MILEEKNNMKKIILIVDDEKDIVDLLKYNLVIENKYDVLTAYNGKEALEILKNNKPDLILLDIMMPEIDGFEVCKKIKSDKSTSNIPIIFLTAKADEIDEILGLEIGADDYIRKPISTRQVLSRIKSVLRRYEIKLASRELPSDEFIKIKQLEINSAAHSVKISGKEIMFPKKEFQLLHFLAARKGKVFSREVLLNQIWGDKVYVVDRTVDVHIAKIREKLEDYADYIETLKGLGYRFKDIE